MPSHVLTDIAGDLWVDSFALAAGPCSVTKRTLRGGRRDGVDLVRIDNGAFSVDVVPTRGMSFRRGHYRGDRIGWTSAVTDGPVHPKFVNLQAAGGLGWLDGYDEMLARCGLENIGAPHQETVESPDGSRRDVLLGLHGRIGNIPAHYLAVHHDESTGAVSLEGHVDESRPFFSQVRLATTITTTPESNRLVVRDEYRNLRESPSPMQVLYHWNFGTPILGAGARVVLPVKSVTPRDARAAEGIDRYEEYEGPTPGFAEQVYFFELLGTGPSRQTIAMLRDREGTRGVAIRFSIEALPAFSLWKNTAGLAEGYVTGLEPSTSYPNARPFEAARGRILTLSPGGSHVVETVLEVLSSAEEVAAIEAEVAAIQETAAPSVNRRPVEPFAPGA